MQIVDYNPEAYVERPGTPPPAVRGRMLDRIERDSNLGILVYYRGMKYPTRGLMNPYAIDASNKIKRFFRSWIFVLFGGWPFSLPPRFLSELAGFCSVTTRPFFLKPEWYSQPVRELHRALSVTLDAESPENEVPYQLINSLCVFLENDRPYRYEWQDVMAEIDLGALHTRPSREVTRLAFIYARRQHHKNLRVVKYAVPLLTLWPSFRRAVRKFAQEVDLSQFPLDKNDKFYCYAQENYDFDGLPLRDRQLIHAGL